MKTKLFILLYLMMINIIFKSGEFPSCSRCGLEHYCSQDCQKEHWKEHKTSCRPVLQVQVYIVMDPGIHRLESRYTQVGIQVNIGWDPGIHRVGSRYTQVWIQVYIGWYPGIHRVGSRYTQVGIQVYIGWDPGIHRLVSRYTQVGIK